MAEIAAPFQNGAIPVPVKDMGDVGGSPVEDEMVIEITEDQIDELLPDDKFKGKDGSVQENGSGIQVQAVKSISDNEFRVTSCDGTQKKASPEGCKPNKRKRADPRHIVKEKSPPPPSHSVSLKKLLTRPVWPVPIAPAPPPTKATPKRAPPSSQKKKTQLSLASPPVNPFIIVPDDKQTRRKVPRPNILRDPSPKVVSFGVPVSIANSQQNLYQATAQTTHLIPSSNPSRPAVTSALAALRNGCSNVKTVNSQPCASDNSDVRTENESFQEFITGKIQAYRVKYSSLNNGKSLNILVMEEHLWLFRKDARCLRYTIPNINLHMKMPAIPCYACGNVFVTKQGFDFHFNRVCTLLKYTCSRCGTVVSAKNKCLFVNELAAHSCVEESTGVWVNLSDLHIEAASPDINSKDLTPRAAITKIVPVPIDMNPRKNYEYIPARITNLTCVECKKKFSSSKELLNHLVPPSVQETYLCENKCGKVLFSACALQAHRFLHTQVSTEEISSLMCPECGETGFESQRIFKKHVNQDCCHSLRSCSFECDFCPVSSDAEIFLSRSDLIKHLLSHHSATYHKCSVCPMAFKTEASMQSHIKQHLEVGVTAQCWQSTIGRCPVCLKMFKDFPNPSNEGHIVAHSMNKMARNITLGYKCYVCYKNQFFSDKFTLIKHMRDVHRNFDFNYKCTCKFCGWDAESKKSLWAHISLIHADRIPSKPSLQSREMHIDITDEPEDIVIEVQDEIHRPTVPTNSMPRTSSSENVIMLDSPPPASLERDSPPSEQPSVVSEQPADREDDEAEADKGNKSEEEGEEAWGFHCNQCHMVFENQSIYERHLKKHMFIKRQKSKKTASAEVEEAKDVQAPRTIGSLSSLNSASKAAVSNDQPCPECKLSFGCIEHLEEHLEDCHGHERHYACYICGLTFNSRSLMDSHAKHAHEGKIRSDVYTCCYCNQHKFFSTKSSISAHLLRGHKVQKAKLDEVLSECLNVKNEMEPENHALKGRKLRQEGESTFTCAKCSYTSENRGEFSSHIKQHLLNKNAVQCPECGLCFTVVSALKRHLLTVHKIRNNLDAIVPKQPVTSTVPLKCSVEIELLDDEPVSKKQKKSPPSKEKVAAPPTDPNQCSVCYRKFGSHDELKKHMRTHGMAFIQSKRSKALIK